MKKTIYCMRVMSGDKVFDLGEGILSIRDHCPNVENTEVKAQDGSVIRIQRFRKDGSRVFVQLVRYVPGERTPTIISSPVSSEDVGDLVSPPEGREYKDADCFLLVYKEYVVFCPNGIGVDKAERYFGNIIFKVSGAKVDLRFIPVPNIDCVDLISKHGVKSIVFKVSAYSLSLDSAFDVGRQPGLFGDLLSIFKKDDSVEEQNSKLNDIMVGIEVSARGNSRASQPSKDVLRDMGLDLLESRRGDGSGDVCIITHNNERLSADSIKLQTTVEIRKAEKSLDYESAFDKMTGYMSDLESEGFLDD